MLQSVSISAKKKSGLDEGSSFTWKVQAEVDSASALESVDFVKGRFLNLTRERLRALPRMKDVSLHISDRRYRLLSVEADGTFLALADDTSQ